MSAVTATIDGETKGMVIPHALWKALKAEQLSRTEFIPMGDLLAAMLLDDEGKLRNNAMSCCGNCAKPESVTYEEPETATDLINRATELLSRATEMIKAESKC